MATTRTKGGRRGRPASTGLTDKQQEVVALAAEGLTAGQAAERLGIAVTGIYNHMTRIRAKGHAIEFATDGGAAAAAASTNGGGTPDTAITEAAKKALGGDAEQYLEALGKVETECKARRASIEQEILDLKIEDEALEKRIVELQGRYSEASKLAQQIEALA